MTNLNLYDVTLLGIDCIDIERLIVAAEICKKNIDFGEVKLLSHIPYDYPHLCKIDPINTIKDYSTFMIKELYKYIHTKYVLIIQWDGFILNHFNWDDDFKKYDYIGAPWRFKDNYRIGNGGFSFRTLQLLQCVASDAQIIDCHPEDIVICRHNRDYLEKKGFKFAPEDTARKFSVESESWDGQFGFHQTDISKASLYELVDGSWHSKLTEIYVNLYARKISVQG